MWRPCGVFDETYAKDMAIVRTSRHWIALIVALVIFLLVPVFGSYYLVSFLNSLAITIIAVLGLTLHVSHGFWSMFQSFGLNHPKYNSIIDACSLLMSAVVCMVFIMIPLLALFFDQFLL